MLRSLSLAVLPLLISCGDPNLFEPRVEPLIDVTLSDCPERQNVEESFKKLVEFAPLKIWVWGESDLDAYYNQRTREGWIEAGSAVEMLDRLRAVMKLAVEKEFCNPKDGGHETK